MRTAGNAETRADARRQAMRERAVRETVSFCVGRMKRLSAARRAETGLSDAMRELAYEEDCDAAMKRGKGSPLTLFFETGYPKTDKEADFVVEAAKMQAVLNETADFCGDVCVDRFVPLDAEKFEPKPMRECGSDKDVLLFSPDALGNMCFERRSAEALAEGEALRTESYGKADLAEAAARMLEAAANDEPYLEIIRLACSTVPDRTARLCGRINPSGESGNPTLGEILNLFAAQTDAEREIQGLPRSERREIRMNRPPETETEAKVLRACLKKGDSFERNAGIPFFGKNGERTASAYADCAGSLTIRFEPKEKEDRPWEIISGGAFRNRRTRRRR